MEKFQPTIRYPGNMGIRLHVVIFVVVVVVYCCCFLVLLLLLLFFRGRLLNFGNY